MTRNPKPATPEQNAAYRAGICIDCLERRHSPGRPIHSLAVGFAAVVDPDDVWVPQLGRQIGFACESSSVGAIARQVRGQQLDGIVSWQPRVLSQIHLAHAARAEHPHDGVSGEQSTFG
jgi:hypothetical protein